MIPSLCLAAILSAAQNPDAVLQDVQRLDGTRITAAEITQRVEFHMARANVAGLAVSVVQNGQIRYQKAFGYADLAARRPLQADTVMYGASFTKAMFAYVVMHLVEEGKLDLNRSIAHYLKKPLPEYPKYADLAGDERWRQLTFAILLSHRTGFSNFRFVEPDGKLRFHFTPGERYAYSGEGINLAQFVLDELGYETGQLFQTRLIQPLGLTRTNPVWRDDFRPNFAFGHLEDGASVGHNVRRNVRAAGSMDTSLADVTRFVLAVSRREHLKKSTWNALFYPQVRIRTATQFPSLNENFTHDYDRIRLSYALGWGVFHTPHGRAVFKEGHDDGWENHMVCFDKRRTCMVLMSNSANGDKTFRQLLADVIGDTYTPWQWEGYAE